MTTGHDDDPDKASWGWPNWRDLDSGTLAHQVNWPIDCILRHVAAGGWHTVRGKRPRSADSAMTKARRRLIEVPRLIPVYAHRYLPAGAGAAGHPVLSVHHLSDIMVYGPDLDVYLGLEFGGAQAPVPFWRDYVWRRDESCRVLRASG